MRRDFLKTFKEKCPRLALQFLNEKGAKRPLCHLPLPKSETKGVYVLGIGHLHWQSALLNWLNEVEDRGVSFIVTLSDDVGALCFDLLKHERVKIGEMEEEVCWAPLYQPWEIIGGTLEREKELADKILESELTLALYREFGALELLNVVKNLEEEGDVRNGRALRGAFQTIPAVICGAGPSLENSLDTLRQMGDKALIFGGGSALGPLSKGGVPLHFLVASDPAPPLERLYRHSYFEVPLFYQNQVSNFLLKCHQGPKLCLGESGSFSLEKWLQEDFDQPPFDVGWSVGTFATSIAVFLGCSPIYLVGMDLCVSEKGAYAKGVEGAFREENRCAVLDRFGNEVTTRPDFLMSKKWLEKRASHSFQTTFVCVSKDGLCLEGLSDGDLSFTTPSMDLLAEVHTAVLKAPFLPLPLARSRVRKLDESLKEVQKSLSHSIEELGKGALPSECAWKKEVFYQLHLESMWKVWKPLLQSDEVVRAMNRPCLEKKLQEILFYQQITEKFIDGRHVHL